ncbi:hypothetical protein [Desulfuromonas acetoxidans]|uniref:hypothetical protein n=1 Tax=Desulfuromonas acetoxidans TaxID=891 RepID=UPI00292EFAF6|nr:hypothetical protein [Desulfuromonas acetoxidans]
MFTLDTSRCPACSKKEKCPDRKMFIQLLSPALAERNADDEKEQLGGDGVIILSCRGDR